MVALVPYANSFIDSKIIDEIVKLLQIDANKRDLDFLFLLIVVVIFASVFEKLLWAAINYSEKLIYFGVNRHFSKTYLEHASELDIQHYENQKTSVLIQKAKDIHEWKPREAINRSFWISADMVRIVASIIIVLNFSVWAFLLVVVTTTPGIIANLRLGKESWGIWDADIKTRYTYWWTKDMLQREETLMELRILNVRDYLLKKVYSLYDTFMNKERKTQVKRSLIESILGNLSTLGILGFWVFCIKATLDGQITIGLLTFYVGATNRFSDALGNFFRRVTYQYEELLFINDFFNFIDLKNNIESGKIALKDTVEPPLIEFKNVDFVYPDTDKKVLQNVSLIINPGEKIAFVGVNGAGKTTIIKLLCRFYDVTAGEILIDGINIKDLDINTWYKKVGVLFQSFGKHGQFSVRENVKLGDIAKEASDQNINDALYKADAQSFIAEYKEGLEQILDKSFEGGIDPSGGQWQRIALGRTFFRDAPVLILDEPTSAIDAQAEFEIFQRLYEFTKEKSVIIISHRFSTVRQADKIFVIDKGAVVESGSHSDLLAHNGEYAKAFKTQAKGYE